jgi:hypothetical protein
MLAMPGLRAFSLAASRGVEGGLGPVQSLTYDSAGNLYYGFRR